jgi:hypothetical protein
MDRKIFMELDVIHFVAGTCCDLNDKGKLENDWYFYNPSDNFPLPCLASSSIIL